MKRVKKYAESRVEKILDLLELPPRSYTVATFHQLRVEIKKLDALWNMVDACAKGFKRKKTFKPYKKIFRQAGKVRELQVEEALLKKHFQNNALRVYKDTLRKQRLEEKAIYFRLIDDEIISRLKRAYHKAVPFLKKLSKKKANRYMDKQREKIIGLLQQEAPETRQLHDLRRKLKYYYYNLDCLEPAEEKQPLHRHDPLPELLGKWNDALAMCQDLEKAIHKNQAAPDEIILLNNALAQSRAECEKYLQEILAAMPKTIALLKQTDIKKL